MRSQPWIPAFLTALRRHGIVTRAAREAGVRPNAAAELRKRDDVFAAMVEEALEEAFDGLEAEIMQRVAEGTPEPVVYQGAVSYEPERDEHGYPLLLDDGRVKLRLDDSGKPIPLTVGRKSDALLIAALKAYRKERFTDRAEVTGAGGQAISVSWQQPKQEQTA